MVTYTCSVQRRRRTAPSLSGSTHTITSNVCYKDDPDRFAASDTLSKKGMTGKNAGKTCFDTRMQVAGQRTLRGWDTKACLVGLLDGRVVTGLLGNPRSRRGPATHQQTPANIVSGWQGAGLSRFTNPPGRALPPRGVEGRGVAFPVCATTEHMRRWTGPFLRAQDAPETQLSFPRSCGQYAPIATSIICDN